MALGSGAQKALLRTPVGRKRVASPLYEWARTHALTWPHQSDGCRTLGAARSLQSRLHCEPTLFACVRAPERGFPSQACQSAGRLRRRARTRKRNPLRPPPPPLSPSQPPKTPVCVCVELFRRRRRNGNWPLLACAKMRPNALSCAQVRPGARAGRQLDH